MVRKAKNQEVLDLLKADRDAAGNELNALCRRIDKLEFKIVVAGFNGRKVKFDKLNEYYPLLDLLYSERNELTKEFNKLERRLDRIR
jgi:hypothetical protein